MSCPRGKTIACWPPRVMKDEGIANPILLGDAAEIERLAAASGFGIDGIRVIDPGKSEKLGEYTEAYVKGRDLNPRSVAARWSGRPLYFAGMMVARGDADTMVAGVDTPTAARDPGGRADGWAGQGPGHSLEFLLDDHSGFPGAEAKTLHLRRLRVNIAPTPAELADIAIASERSAGSCSPRNPAWRCSLSRPRGAHHVRINHVTEAGPDQAAGRRSEDRR